MSIVVYLGFIALIYIALIYISCGSRVRQILPKTARVNETIPNSEQHIKMF